MVELQPQLAQNSISVCWVSLSEALQSLPVDSKEEGMSSIHLLSSVLTTENEGGVDLIISLLWPCEP